MMKRKFLSGAVTTDAALGARQIRVIASTGNVDRVGDVLVPGGCDMSGFNSNPIVLADHNPTTPIGTAAAEMRNGRIEAVITFAPSGVSEKADEYCGLTKAGILKAVSVGFDPIDMAPRKDATGRQVGWTFNKWALLELSVVAVPANADALVIGRSHGKAGRVLSGANADALRQAHDHAEAARAIVADVLDGAEPDADDRQKRAAEIERLRGRHQRLADVEQLRDDPELKRRKREIEILGMGGV